MSEVYIPPQANRGRPWRHRSAEQVLTVLRMLCDAMWNKGTPPPGAHVWSIPANEDRDFDCILYDLLAEREALREAALEAYRALAIRYDANIGAEAVELLRAALGIPKEEGDE